MAEMKEAKKEMKAEGKAPEKSTVKTEKKVAKATEKKEIKRGEIKEGSLENQLKFYDVILFPLISEKAINMIERENKITFISKKDATKATVKEAIEKMFGVKVDGVNVLNDMKGRKKCIVKINKSFKADEIATKLGVI